MEKKNILSITRETNLKLLSDSTIIISNQKNIGPGLKSLFRKKCLLFLKDYKSSKVWLVYFWFTLYKSWTIWSLLF